MGFHNPRVSWSQLESALSGNPAQETGEQDARTARPAAREARVVDPLAVDADGGDSPVWSRKRQPYQAPPLVRTEEKTIPYAELHCHTNFSFLDGASHPEELAEEAARLGLTGLAVTDHDGFYGVVRFSEAARDLDLPTIFGTELSLGLTKSDGYYTFEYGDNGPGLDVALFNGKSKSLGLHLVKRLSKQLGGSAEYRYEKGSIFSIRFPEH